MDTQYSSEPWESGQGAVHASDPFRMQAAARSAVSPRTARQGVVLYGLDLAWYMRVIRTPVLYGGVLVLCAVLLAAVLPGIWGEGADALSFVVKLAVWIAIGWHGVRAREGGTGAAALAGGISGLAIGIVLALLRVLVVREVWTVFNLIIEPVVTGVFGYLVSGTAALSRKPFMRTPVVPLA